MIHARSLKLCVIVKATDKDRNESPLLFYRPLKARRINDQLMLLDRAFLNPLAFPDKYGFRYHFSMSSTISNGTHNTPHCAEPHTFVFWWCDLNVIHHRVSCRHVIWASRSSGVATFPGLADAMAQAKTSGLKQDWAQAHKHLSIVTQAISGAAHTLAEAHAAL